MTDGWKEFNVEAYNARLAAMRDKPYLVAAKEARTAAREIPALLESDVLPTVLEALRYHPKVDWVERFNSGVFHVEDRTIRAAFTGCSDIIGQLKDGRMLAVEVKRPGGVATADQQAFLHRVGRAGVAFVATGVDDVWRCLKSA
jgi:VRR-NUC domain